MTNIINDTNNILSQIDIEDILAHLAIRRRKDVFLVNYFTKNEIKDVLEDSFELVDVSESLIEESILYLHNVSDALVSDTTETIESIIGLELNRRKLLD